MRKSKLSRLKGGEVIYIPHNNCVMLYLNREGSSVDTDESYPYYVMDMKIEGYKDEIEEPFSVHGFNANLDVYIITEIKMHKIFQMIHDEAEGIRKKIFKGL